MNNEIERSIREILVLQIKIAILDSELKGLPINKEEILLIIDRLAKQ